MIKSFKIWKLIAEKHEPPWVIIFSVSMFTIRCFGCNCPPWLLFWANSALWTRRNAYCSDFRYESYEIFVLGVGFFFFRQISTFQLAIFDGTFFISFERYCCPELKFEKIFYLWSFFVMLRGFKDCHFCQFGTVNARYISRYSRVSVELIRLRNRSKLVKEAYLP